MMTSGETVSYNVMIRCLIIISDFLFYRSSIVHSCKQLVKLLPKKASSLSSASVNFEFLFESFVLTILLPRRCYGQYTSAS